MEKGLNTLMGISLMDSGKMGKEKEQVWKDILMVEHMLENGKMTKNMEMEGGNTQMEEILFKFIKKVKR